MESRKKFVYNDEVWFWESRTNPYAEGSPDWQKFDKVTSKKLEEHFFNYTNKYTDDPEIVISPNYKVNVYTFT